MKKILIFGLMGALCMCMIGCINPAAVVVAADAGINAYEASVPEGSDQYVLAQKIDDELQGLNVLFKDGEAATSDAKAPIATKIASLAAVLVKDDQTLLDLVAVKNPTKREIVAGAIAAVEAFIVIVQDKYPNPSGDSVQLNSNAAELKAAVK